MNNQKEHAIKVYQDYINSRLFHSFLNDTIINMNNSEIEPIISNVNQGLSDLFLLLGTVGVNKNDFWSSLIYLQMAVFLNPNNNLAIISLATVYQKFQQHKKAFKISQKINNKKPHLKTSMQIQSAVLLHNDDHKQQAFKYLSNIIATKPHNIEALFTYANLQLKNKNYSLAVENFNKAINLINKDNHIYWVVFFQRGIAYERQKKWLLAEKDFKKALKLNNNQPDVLNYLAYSWLENNINLEEALEMLKKAVSIRPNSGAFLDSLAWAYYKLGDSDKALQLLEKAIKIAPGDPVVRNHLGDVYWKLGRKIEAKFQWKHAINLNIDDNQKEKVNNKIEYGF